MAAGQMALHGLDMEMKKQKDETTKKNK